VLCAGEGAGGVGRDGGWVVVSVGGNNGTGPAETPAPTCSCPKVHSSRGQGPQGVNVVMVECTQREARQSAEGAHGATSAHAT
jgi:hypothetical protein